MLGSGCAETFKAIRDGQPDMNNPSIFNRDFALHGPQVYSAVDNIPRQTPPDGTPVDCVLRTGEKDTDRVYITRCTEGIRYLIDKSWESYQGDLLRLNTAGSFLADATVMGLSTSVPLVAPGTRSVLAAIISGINGLKTNAQEDLLFKNSIQLIVLQMTKDRNSWLAVIENNLNLGRYQSMTEASTDLYSYFIAGTWDHALISMQSDAGAQNAACEAAVKTIKSATGTEAASTGIAQCSTNNSSATLVPAPIFVAFAEGSQDIADAADADGRKAVQDAIDKYNAAQSAGTDLQLTLQGMTDAAVGGMPNADLAAKRVTSVQNMLTTTGKLKAEAVTISTSPDLRSKPGVTISFALAKPPTTGSGDNSGQGAGADTHTTAPPPAPTTAFTQADLKPNAIFTDKNDATVVITGVQDPDGNITFVGPDANGTLKPGNQPVTTLFPTLKTLVKPGHT